MSFEVTIRGGTSKRLPTAGKYCEQDIIIHATDPLISDLTDTTWIIRNWSATAGYGVFNITGSATYTPPHGAETTTAFTELRIGYIYNSPADNKISTPSNDITADTYIMKFAPSPDVTNPDLIDWVCANGELHNETQGEENQLHGTLDGTLETIDSPVSKVIGYACYGITTLKTVNLPNATSIGSSTFRGCSGMTSFNAPNVTSLGTYAFYGCSKLTEVNFQGISNIPSTCFYQCTSMTRADFGVKCKSISASGLAYCSKLTTLILRYPDAVVSITTNAFSGANFKGYVYVPSALLEAYESNSNWASYAGTPKFRAIEDYPDICG